MLKLRKRLLEFLYSEVGTCIIAVLFAIGIGLAAVACTFLVPEISREQQVRDLKYYADAFERGEYDGHLIWRLGYRHGRDYYVKAYSVTEGEWTLKVGDFYAIIGATLPDTSEEALLEAYREGRGWSRWQVWNEDYTEEYTRSTYGSISKYDNLTGESDPWFCSINKYVSDDIEELTIEKLVEMSHEGWNGETLYCRNSRQVAFVSERGIVIASPRSVKAINVFPCLGHELFPDGHAAYDQESGLTFYVSEKGASVYAFDGAELFHRDICGKYNPDEAFVRMTDLSEAILYCGDDVVWKFNTKTMEIVPLITDVDHRVDYRSFALKDGCVVNCHGEEINWQ